MRVFLFHFLLILTKQTPPASVAQGRNKNKTRNIRQNTRQTTRRMLPLLTKNSELSLYMNVIRKRAAAETFFLHHFST